MTCSDFGRTGEGLGNYCSLTWANDPFPAGPRHSEESRPSQLRPSVPLKNDDWPGLTPDKLFIGEDLQVTTDFRHVFAEALFAHLGMSSAAMGPIFPGFSVNQSNFPDLYA